MYKGNIRIQYTIRGNKTCLFVLEAIETKVPFRKIDYRCLRTNKDLVVFSFYFFWKKSYFLAEVIFQSNSSLAINSQILLIKWDQKCMNKWNCLWQGNLYLKDQSQYLQNSKLKNQDQTLWHVFGTYMARIWHVFGTYLAQNDDLCLSSLWCTWSNLVWLQVKYKKKGLNLTFTKLIEIVSRVLFLFISNWWLWLMRLKTG